MSTIAHLFNPGSVAVIGASSDIQRTAGKPVRFLRKHGFSGRIYPVNPRLEAIGDLRCYPDVASLPEAPDVGLVLLGAPDRVQQSVAELAAKGGKTAIVLASGYGESGADGVRRQEELARAAGSMRLLGPNTIGLVNITDGVPISASGALEMEHVPSGAIAVVSQSGGILGSLLSRAAGRGIGLSKLVSTGNEADLELADFVAHLAEDPATRVIVLYIEGIRNPQRFRWAALKARHAGKPVVAYKIGRSDAGARAAASHTGALAGSDRMYDAFFRSVGVLRVQTFADLLDIPAALCTGRTLKGNRIAVLTSTGGAGTLVSDNLGLHGFQTPAPDAATAARLRALDTGDQAVLDRNPIDVTLAGLRPNVLEGAIAALLDSPAYDALTIIVGSSGVAAPELMSNAIEACLPLSDKPVIAYVSPHAPAATALLTARGVPAYAAPESCAAALAGLRHAAAASPARAKSAAAAPQGLDLAPGVRDEAAAKALFAAFGIAHAREEIVATADEARCAAQRLGGRVALKALAPALVHKSDAGGVALDLDADRIGAALGAMAQAVEARGAARPTRFLVQEMISGGTEVILGLHRDPLGAAILVGMGGTAAELVHDTAMMLLEADGLAPDDALELLRQLKLWPLLDGYRGRPKADVPALVAAVVGFARMAVALGPRLVEAEINPLLVLPQGRGVRAVDGLAVFA